MKKITPISILASLVFLVLLNYPILNAANKPELIWGIPALALYFFFAWALLIVLLIALANQIDVPEK